MYVRIHLHKLDVMISRSVLESREDLYLGGLRIVPVLRVGKI